MTKAKTPAQRRRDALEILKGGLSDPHQTRPRKETHPPGMTPRVNLEKGEIVGAFPAGQDPCWGEFLTKMGFENMLDVLDVIEVRAWDVCSNEHGVQTMHYVRAKCRRKAPVDDRIDVDALAKQMRRRKLPKPKAPITDHGLLACLADWQAGKREGGGIKALIDRVFVCLDRLILRIKKERPSEVVLAGMGDLIEGCGDHYPMQTFLVDSDRREQCRVVRRLLLEIITRVARYTPKVVVVCVGGNHGENRKNGKAYTTFGDNDDVAVFEQVAEICAQNENLNHVEFRVPDQELTATVTICGVPVAFAHGHQCKSILKVIGWWKDMGHNDHPVGDCTLLITAHWHHLRVIQTGPKTHMQCPALDGASEWWEHRGGDRSMPGILTVNVGRCFGSAGWDGMRVL